MVIGWNFEKGFQHNALVSFANTVTKLFGKNLLQQSEHAKLKNSTKKSANFHMKKNPTKYEVINGTKYSRMDQVKFVEDSL